MTKHVREAARSADEARRIYALRDRMEVYVEELIELLDALDGDIDREEDDPPEPWLGSTTDHQWQDQRHWVGGLETDDREIEDDREQDDSDREPDLGTTCVSAHHDQRLWAVGDSSDMEDDPSQTGIADEDGLLEQVGRESWFRTEFVW